MIRFIAILSRLEPVVVPCQTRASPQSNIRDLAQNRRPVNETGLKKEVPKAKVKV